MVALAREYTAAGDPDAAILALQIQQMMGGRAGPDLHVAQGEAYAAKGYTAQAEAEYLAALEQDPDHARAQAALLAAGGTLPTAKPAAAGRSGGEPLAAAAMWADVAPWYLQSESDLVFFQPNPMQGVEPVRLQYEGGGEATAVTFSGQIEGRFERMGPLTPGWEPEGEACYMPG